MNNLFQEDWRKELEANSDSVILDVRTEEELAHGFIPGATNIDIYKGQGFIYRLDELDKTKHYYVYCQAGVRSAKACLIMRQMGFENTYNLHGGFDQWKGEIAYF